MYPTNMSANKASTLTHTLSLRRLLLFLAIFVLAAQSSFWIHRSSDPSLKCSTVIRDEEEFDAHHAKTSQHTSASSSSYKLPNIGSLGPIGSDREHYKYYDSLYFITQQFGWKAKSVLEVGCTDDPFIKHLTWIPQKECVAPYSAYGKSTENSNQVMIHVADFYDWTAPRDDKYDLLICGQVVEHVDDPHTFVQKFFMVAKRTIIFSVPYKWSKKQYTPGHKHHNIDLPTILNWTYPYSAQPSSYTIVEDHTKERIIVVFESKKKCNDNGMCTFAWPKDKASAQNQPSISFKD